MGERYPRVFEITPEMVKAGVEELSRSRLGKDLGEIAIDVFNSMLAASPPKSVDA